MIGRIAITLCVLVQAAMACPPDDSIAGDDARGPAVAFTLMGISTLLFAITRRNAVRRTFVTSRRKEAASLGLAQALARIHLKRALVLAATCVFALYTITGLSIDAETRLVWCVTPTIVLGIAIATLYRLHRVLGSRDVNTMAHSGFLYLARDGELVGWVAAPPWLVSRVAGLPVARAR